MPSHPPCQPTDQARTLDPSGTEQRAALFTPYLTPPELAEVRRRMLAHAGDWEALFAQASVHIAGGAAPRSDQAQILARRWADLFRAAYAGDDDALDGKVRDAFAREPGLTAHIDIGLIDFMRQALMHLHRPALAHGEAGEAGPKPSARGTAILRAVHQLLDAPLILDDPLALTILGPAQEAALRADARRHRNPIGGTLRATMAVRSRLAEDSWRQARRDGVRQYVILGAGLDTSAYRDGAPADVDVFEVDLPATQRWKRDCLRAAGIAAPPNLRYVALDFSDATLERGLTASGFDPARPAMFSWLGVSMYLPAHCVLHTLRYMARCAPGSAIVFDFLMAPALLAPSERAGLALMAAGLAEQGEALQSHFDPAALEAMLRRAGFARVAHWDARALSRRYLSERDDGLRLSTVFGMIEAGV